MITSHAGGKSYRYPKIVVSMTDFDIVERVAKLFGTSVYVIPLIPNRKQQWRAQISGHGAVEWMTRLYPWLGARRRTRIDQVLAEYEEIEPTYVRRQRSCAVAASSRRRDNQGRFTGPGE